MELPFSAGSSCLGLCAVLQNILCFTETCQMTHLFRMPEKIVYGECQMSNAAADLRTQMAEGKELPRKN